MRKRILVAYATGTGSTREVAEAIAAEIEGEELSANVQNVRQIANVSLYSGIILGSSIRMGRWLPEAVACLQRIKADLPGKPAAFFTTCLTMVDDTKENRGTVLKYMQPVLNLVPDIKPIGLGLFAGSLAPQRQLLVADGPQGDFRNWEGIRNWAKAMRISLLEHEGVVQPEQPITILSYTDMSYTDLSQVNLEGAELHAAYLVEANMEASHLAWTDLSDSQMQGVNLFQANLIGAIMTNAILKEANLAEATMNGAILQNADFSRANLASADMNWVDFSGANLAKANLQHARLGWAKLVKANLEGANLTGARYNKHTVWPDGFSPEKAGCIIVR